jgi:hypothetical protein
LLLSPAIELIPPRRTILEGGADVTARTSIALALAMVSTYFDIAIMMARDSSGGEMLVVPHWPMYDILLKS